MPPRSFLIAPLAATIVLAAPGARAHIALQSPPPREAEQKEGPCGSAGSKRGTKVTTFKPGQTITVRWKETIGHPGHFRISFDPNGQSGFVDPKTADERSSAPTVLVDGIKDKTGTQVYEQDVTLPDVECDTCTLQLIQVMTDKPPYGDGDDLYYQCADITLSNAATSDEPDAGDDPNVPEPTTSDTTAPAAAEDGGCRATAAPKGWREAAVLAAATGLVLAKRRRTRRRGE